MPIPTNKQRLVDEVAMNELYFKEAIKIWMFQSPYGIVQRSE
jgi:hypothetical protein